MEDYCGFMSPRQPYPGVAEMNLEALSVLAADYDAANMSYAAADLRRRLEHYREREIIEVWV